MSWPPVHWEPQGLCMRLHTHVHIILGVLLVLLGVLGVQNHILPSQHMANSTAFLWLNN